MVCEIKDIEIAYLANKMRFPRSSDETTPTFANGDAKVLPPLARCNSS
jgi:hypothetical protein